MNKCVFCAMQDCLVYVEIRKGGWIPCKWDKDVCNLPCGQQELTTDPLQELQVLLTTEPSLQDPNPPSSKCKTGCVGQVFISLKQARLSSEEDLSIEEILP